MIMTALVIRKICYKYQIENIQDYLLSPLSKTEWKTLITRKVHKYWIEQINRDVVMYTTLRYLNASYTIGKVHPILTTATACMKDISKLPVRLKILTGTYILQTNRAIFNKNKVDPQCKLCDKSEETVTHFLLECDALLSVRRKLVQLILERCTELLTSFNIGLDVCLDLTLLIANPYHLAQYVFNSRMHSDLCTYIACNIEPACRTLIYKLHVKRYILLDGCHRTVRKNNLS